MRADNAPVRRRGRRREMHPSFITTLPFAIVPLVAGYAPAARTSLAATASRSRAAALMNEWPPPLDAVHVFSISFPTGPKLNIALSQMTNAEAAALLPIWKLQHDSEPDGMAPASIGEVCIRPTSVPFGIYLNGMDAPANALSFVQFETSEEQIKLMIIESLILAPTVPPQLRAPLQGAVARVLVAMGEAQGMTVQRLDSFDV